MASLPCYSYCVNDLCKLGFDVTQFFFTHFLKDGGCLTLLHKSMTEMWELWRKWQECFTIIEILGGSNIHIHTLKYLFKVLNLIHKSNIEIKKSFFLFVAKFIKVEEVYRKKMTWSLFNHGHKDLPFESYLFVIQE